MAAACLSIFSTHELKNGSRSSNQESKSEYLYRLVLEQQVAALRSLTSREEVGMSELPITYRGTVYPWHCDHMGHMNVMWYVGKFDEATWQLLSNIGLSRSRLEKEGAGMAAVEQHIEYKRELRAGDLVTIRS